MANLIQEYKELALLWLQNQNLSDITPEELFQKYNEAYKRIQTEAAKDKPAQRISY